jgi:DNA gyrase subunit A
VVGAGSAPDDAELVFVTSDAQLLHFAASGVRPQGAPAGGMAGIKLGAKAEVIAFSVLDSGGGHRRDRVRRDRHDRRHRCGPREVVAFAEFPGKGRATGGVRAHAFLKGEDRLTLAWVGAEPALAVGRTDRRVRCRRPVPSATVRDRDRWRDRVDRRRARRMSAGPASPRAAARARWP